MPQLEITISCFILLAEAGSRRNLIIIVFIESLKCFLVLEAIESQLVVIS